MNSSLLNRSLGTLDPPIFAREQQTRFLHALQPTPIRFSGRAVSSSAANGVQDAETLAHPVGVNAITLDKWEGRYLLSGGADGNIKLWDLEGIEGTSSHTYHPSGTVKKYVA